MIQLLRTLIFFGIFYLGSLIISLLGFVFTYVWPGGVTPIAHLWGRFHYWCCRWILNQRVRVIGEMPQGAHFYCFKHEAGFETIELLRLFYRPAPIAKEELMQIPFWGRIARKFGLVPIHRESGPHALRVMLKTARSAQAENRPLILFPEGHRMPHGQKPPLQAGMAGIYKLLGLPIIPVALDSGRLWPRKGFVKGSGVITYKVGETIPAGLSREEVEARVHAAINALNP